MRSRFWVVLVAATAALAVAPPQLQEALQAQRGLARDNPTDPEVLNDLGNLLMLAGELEEAEVFYDRALQLDPDRASTRYNLALLLQESGRSRQAMKEYQRVLEIDPRHAWAHYQLGTIYAEAGRRSRAVRHYAEALVLEPDLIVPEVNPHILENRLATEALIVARRSGSPASLAPRLYQQPSRIADLLLPPPQRIHEPLDPDQQQKVEDFDASRRRIRTRWVPAPSEQHEEDEDGGLQRGNEADSLPDESVEGDSDPAEPPSSPEEPPSEPRVITERDLVPSLSGQVTPVERTRSRGRSTGRPSRPIAPSIIGFPPTPPSVTSPGPQPGLPSTGRLDLELLPPEAELLAALPTPSTAKTADHGNG